MFLTIVGPDGCGVFSLLRHRLYSQLKLASVNKGKCNKDGAATAAAAGIALWASEVFLFTHSPQSYFAPIRAKENE